MGRFAHDADLLDSFEGFCLNNRIKAGVFNLVGALKSVKLGYYDQKAKKYVNCVQLEKKLEIASCSGNISLRGSRIFVHAHITLADLKGRCWGGHLMKGSKIFAAEYFIQELKGKEFIRVYDKATGLNLWPLK